VTSAGPFDSVRRRLELTVPEVWLAYFALGGTMEAFQLGQYLHGRGPEPTAAQRNVLAHALNEALLDHHQPAVLPYAPLSL
jgi:hypothetical protein